MAVLNDWCRCRSSVSRRLVVANVRAVCNRKRYHVDTHMSDDIVTRLRKIAPIHEGRKGHGCIAEAADEIERLRAENHGLKIKIVTLIKKIESLAVHDG